MEQNKLDKIKALCRGGDYECLRLGLITLGSVFTKKELVASLVPLTKIPELEDKLIGFDPGIFRKLSSPFGILGCGCWPLMVVFEGFCLHMGFGPAIVYCDERHAPDRWPTVLNGEYHKITSGEIIDLRKNVEHGNIEYV